jgi:hypothetical protein
LIRDRDSNASRGEIFTRVAIGTPIKVLKTPYRAPKANAIGMDPTLGRHLTISENEVSPDRLVQQSNLHDHIFLFAAETKWGIP